MDKTNCDIAIVGGGTAGLALATRLCALGVKDVVVLERETNAGGAPRHCDHYPFGLYEFKRLLKGPDYARALVTRAQNAGVDIRTGISVIALHSNARLTLTDATGSYDLQAKRVVLATGVRESSRAQRFLSGDRPQGVLTTGALQSMLYLHHRRPFKKPVIVGTELVSFSAIQTCKHAGIHPIAMVEENTHLTARRVLRPYPALRRVPLHFEAQDLHIHGHHQVEAISFTTPNAVNKTIETDGVIISGKFRPEAALLHASHITLDPATGGPNIDQYGRTSDPSYFSIGNLLRPVESSNWCWAEAVAAAPYIAHDLETPATTHAQTSVPLTSIDPAIRYVLPQRLERGASPGAMRNVQLRLTQPTSGWLTARAGGTTLASTFLDSRPERRILMSIGPLLESNGPVEFQIVRRD